MERIQLSARYILICLVIFQLAACTASVPHEPVAGTTNPVNFITETPTATVQATLTTQPLAHTETPALTSTATLTPTLTASATISPTNTAVLVVLETWTPLPTVWKIESPFRERQMEAQGPRT